MEFVDASPSARMLIITYRGRPAIFVADGRAHLAPAVDALEADHPIRRWTMCLAFFALSVIDGAIPGRYTAARAEHFARCALIPEREFVALECYDDAVLAERFGVPLEQIAQRKRDLAIA